MDFTRRMSILTFLYKLFIGPLELFFEITYSMAYRFLGDPAMAIVALSLAMNFLVLPLYRRADAMQEEQRDLAIAMKPWTDHIKKTFKGDERFMMLQTYNRQNGYKQTDILKSSISLLLEIPFFIAAFHFLSGLELLNGVQLGPIADLGAPDALLQVGGININVLPIIMTLINVVSAAIYLRGFPLSSKIQTYGIAAIFLILLYNSPAGLVFYWTLNNIFSLVKNIFYKLKNPGLVLSVLASITGIAIPLLALAANLELSPLRIAFIAGLFIGLQIPLLSYVIKQKRKAVDKPRRFNIPEATEQDNRIFALGCIFMALLCGLLIPILLVQVSPQEFINTNAFRSPLLTIAESFVLALGTFVVWFGVFYWLATPKVRTIFNVLLFAIVGAGIVNYLFFGTNYGNLSAYLQFDAPPESSVQEQVLNAVVYVAVIVLLAILWLRKRAVPRIAYTCLCIAAVCMTVVGAVTINASDDPIKQELALAAETEQELPKITLSKTGKNVVVIMLDRAIPGFIPYLVHEKPELKETLAGFTVYTNAISYGTHTNVGNVPIWGGSDYRPLNINEQTNKPLAEKQDEALKLMPTLFAEAGYDNLLFDPPLAGYRWMPDLSIFDDIPNTKGYNTEHGMFYEGAIQTEEGRNHFFSQLSRNFFCYSIFKMTPLSLQHVVYQDAGYNSTNPLVQVQVTSSIGMGINLDYMNTYSVLASMPSITTAGDNSNGNFFMMCNSITHSPTILKEPDFTVEEYVDNREYDEQNMIRYTDDGDALDFSQGSLPIIYARRTHYEVNMSAMLAVGEWCEHLREMGLYDNTRIIIVSDHSWPYAIDDKLYFTVYDEEDGIYYYRDPRWFKCTLMVKDFDSHEFTYDDTFMTNADVPVLATKDIIQNPTNPFTGNPVDSSYKEEGRQYLLDSDEWDIALNNGETFLPGRWFSVMPGDTEDKNNWTYEGTY